MTWKTIWERLQSPVVIFEIVFIIGGAVVLAWPGLADGWKIIAGAIAAIYSVFAGLNNPTDRANF